MVLSGVAVLVLVAALLVPWWSYAFYYQGDHIQLTLYPGLTFSQTCTGGNCSVDQIGTFTYSSAGLAVTDLLMGDLGGWLGVDLAVGLAGFLVAMFAWVDRARLGAVRTTLVVSAAAGVLALGLPMWASLALPGALAYDVSGASGATSLGPLEGWYLMILAAVLFFAAAVAEGTTLRYARSWDDPLVLPPPTAPEEDPPVTTPPDRVRRLELLWRTGAISQDEFEAQRSRVLSSEGVVGPVPIPPNPGSRKAARAHIEYLRESGRYAPEQLEAQTQNVLRAYGLSSELLFPEEELQALVVRLRAGTIGKDEFDRQKAAILDRI